MVSYYVRILHFVFMFFLMLTEQVTQMIDLQLVIMLSSLAATPLPGLLRCKSQSLDQALKLNIELFLQLLLKSYGLSLFSWSLAFSFHQPLLYTMTICGRLTSMQTLFFTNKLPLCLGQSTKRVSSGYHMFPILIN